MSDTKLTLKKLSEQIWADNISENLIPIENSLYQKGFHILGLEPPTIDHFDTLLNGYDRKMNYALKQIFKVLSNNNVEVKEEINASLYQAIKNMIPTSDKYVQQNIDELIIGEKTFQNYIAFLNIIDGQKYKARIGAYYEQIYFDIINVDWNKKTTYTLGNPDDHFKNLNLDHPSNHNEIVTGNKLLTWWNKINPRLTENTNIGLKQPVGIIEINNNIDFYNLPTGYTGVANISKHPELKSFNFTNNLIYVEKIATFDQNAFLVRIKGIGIGMSDLTHEGVAYGNRYQIKWTRESTDFEIIKKTYPRGICVFFASNINPNVEWQGSGMQWEYIAEDRVVKLGLMNGADLWEMGGADDISLQEVHMPPHTHEFSADTSWEADKTIWTSWGGEHNHKLNVCVTRTEMSWYKWSWADGRPRTGDNYTDIQGGHNHSFVIPGHKHWVSGSTTSRGSGWGFSVRNKYVKLMAWWRKV